MVKQRFSSADVAAEVSCLQRCLGMRVANVYDINPKVGGWRGEAQAGRPACRCASPAPARHLTLPLPHQDCRRMC